MENWTVCKPLYVRAWCSSVLIFFITKPYIKTPCIFSLVTNQIIHRKSIFHVVTNMLLYDTVAQHRMAKFHAYSLESIYYMYSQRLSQVTADSRLDQGWFFLFDHFSVSIKSLSGPLQPFLKLWFWVEEYGDGDSGLPRLCGASSFWLPLPQNWISVVFLLLSYPRSLWI